MKVEVLSISDLLNNNNINWVEVETDLKVSAVNFELLLFKIHLTKNFNKNSFFRENVLTFLSMAYNCLSDIRYYNEFLWIYKSSTRNRHLKNKCEKNFFNNLSESNHHTHNFDIQKMKNLIKENALCIYRPTLEGLNIGLIGLPLFFGNIHKILEKQGAKVEQIFIPKHPKKIINILLRNRYIVKFASLIYGNPYFYRTIGSQINNSVISDQLKSLNLDLGFHKLNFIIRSNIFKPFRIGLINDHWAPLPFIRGKSSLAYSVLFGFPIVVTTHLVEEGIDTGKIIKYFLYEIDHIKKIKKIRAKVRKNLPNRVVESIQCITSPSFHFIENEVTDGLTFYQIHPILYDFIEKKILTK